jgi:hypothetical protein
MIPEAEKLRPFIRWYRDERGDVILMWPYIGEDFYIHWYWWT